VPGGCDQQSKASVKDYGLIAVEKAKISQPNEAWEKKRVAIKLVNCTM
jgi:hypothetical protein